MSARSGVETGRSFRITSFDCFAVLNASLFAVFTVAVSRSRFSTFRGSAHVLEFYLYACFTLGMIVLAWWWLRRQSLSVPLTVLAQGVILLDFAAGLVRVGQGRLYDLVVLSVRFDKLVHLLNAIFLSFFVAAVLRSLGARLEPIRGLVVVLLVLGLGTVWEIAEYIVVAAAPNAGVGDYDNNLQDLLACLVGGVVSRLLPVRWRAPFEGPPAWRTADGTLVTNDERAGGRQ
jgi:hypothetical protein